MPVEFVDDLPARYGVAQKGVDFRWRRRGTATGQRRNRRDPGAVGLELRSTDVDPLSEIRDRIGGTSFASGNRLTLVIDQAGRLRRAARGLSAGADPHRHLQWYTSFRREAPAPAPGRAASARA